MRLLPPEATLLRVRPARPADHAAFVRLFPELAVDDPTLDEAQFVQKVMPETVVLEAAEGPDPTRMVGYAFFQIMKST